MASPAYRFSRRLADQPADSAGRRWFVKEAADAAAGGGDLRAELLARALFASGGVVVRPTLDLTGSTATITGPALGITFDGLAPLLADPGGAGVELDLDTLGNAYADGTHRIVLWPDLVTTERTFTTPEVGVRDPQGNVVETVQPEPVTYDLVERLGGIRLREGTTVASGEVLLATVEKAGGTWSNLEPAGGPPSLRSQLDPDDPGDVGYLASGSGTTQALDLLVYQAGAFRPGRPRRGKWQRPASTWTLSPDDHETFLYLDGVDVEYALDDIPTGFRFAVFVAPGSGSITIARTGSGAISYVSTDRVIGNGATSITLPERCFAILERTSGDTFAVVIVRSGIPAGGTTGQVLAKASGDDFDVEWVTP